MHVAKVMAQMQPYATPGPPAMKWNPVYLAMTGLAEQLPAWSDLARHYLTMANLVACRA